MRTASGELLFPIPRQLKTEARQNETSQLSTRSYDWTGRPPDVFELQANRRPWRNLDAQPQTHLRTFAGVYYSGRGPGFEAVGGAGHSGEASISLRRLQTRFGKFNHADVYEYDKQGKVFSQQSLNVDPDSAIAFKATSERRYLIYPDLGPRYRNTYIVACNLGRARLAGQNLSNNENFERSPDVNHHSARIVFESGGQHSGLVLMDLNGNGRTLIPGTVTASHPKWGRDAESFIVYVDRESNVNNSIHRVRPDGNDNVEVVHADGEKVIRIVEV